MRRSGKGSFRERPHRFQTVSRLTRPLGAFAVLTASIVLGEPAHAAALGCKTGNAIHATFDAPDTRWNSDSHTIRDGRLSIAPPANGTAWTWNLGVTDFRNATICAVLLNHPGESDEFDGLTFWGTIVHGEQQFYFLMVKPDGAFAVFWSGDGGFRRVVEPRRHRAVRLGENAANVLRITTKGQSATFFINEEKVATINTDRTDVPWTAGLIAEGSSKPKQWVFSAFDASRQKLELSKLESEEIVISTEDARSSIEDVQSVRRGGRSQSAFSW